jgi:NO-binding membrane sensor protein with MHYT domain
MLAMFGPYVVYYDPGIVIGSSLLAVVVSSAGLFIVVQCAYVGASWFSLVIRAAAAVVIAVAVNSVHYTGMYAASYHFTGDENDNFNVHLGHNMHVQALIVLMMAFIISVVQLLGTHSHLNSMARRAIAVAKMNAGAGNVNERLKDVP